jgi:hypothetical protein
MGEHGYETVEDELCIAGTSYRELFKRRVMDFVSEADVGYYKWDGIRFSCSESDHGHPVGIYSRRAVMETVIDLCKTVRTENPDIFLNITSGTWLSPWWLKHADTVWMQGRDYGYANVPSISRRDRAITYRDYVLHEDLRKHEFWYPIDGLMTHGIIKGHLQKLGGETEPLDKFTDNALLYFARGVAMWELYISPDLLSDEEWEALAEFLSDEEWEALAESIRWAEDRFDTLRHTEMIGGDPGEREAYGYAHFSGRRGIVVARNPAMESQTLEVELSSSFGLDSSAESLVVERVYPSRWISSRLFDAGSVFVMPLQGYETAVYEIYPLEKAEGPLPAGVVFEDILAEGESWSVDILEASEEVKILNPESVSGVRYDGVRISPSEFDLPTRPLPSPVDVSSIDFSDEAGSEGLEIKLALHESASDAVLAVLIELGSEPAGNLLDVVAEIDGAESVLDSELQEGRWGWYRLALPTGEHTCRILYPGVNPGWEGTVSVWLTCLVSPERERVSFELTREVERRPMPPRPWPRGKLRVNEKLGETEIR